MSLDLLNDFWKRTEQEANFKRYASRVRAARPFTLDAELTEVVSELAFRKATPRALARYTHAARLPYPTMWIEADYGLAFKGRSAGAGFEYGEPTKVGWLLEESGSPEGSFLAIRVAFSPDPEAPGEYLASVYPLVHFIRTEGRFDYSIAFSGLAGNAHEGLLKAMRTLNQVPGFRQAAWQIEPPEITTDAFGQRQTIYEGAASLDYDGLSSTLLEPYYSQRLADDTPEADLPMSAARLMSLGMRDQAGDVAFLVTALALLNEVPVRFVPFRPSGVIRAGGRLKPFLTSSVVTIEVPSTRRRLREIDKHLQSRGEANRKARHEVRGHWRHSLKLPTQHPERWERSVDRSGRPCWRTWISHHERGDASLGWVKQSYKAVARPGASSALVESSVDNPPEA